MQTLLRTALLLPALALAGWADFSYVETSELTGGSMKSMVQMAGRFGGQSMNTKTHVFLSGSRMAQIREDSATVIDLDAETITDINYKKRETSVTTFAQMRQALDAQRAELDKRMAKARKDNPDAADLQMRFNVEVNDPGRNETVNGMDAKEMILLVTAEAQQRGGGPAGAMNIATNMWLAEVDGSDEVRRFYQAMSEKLNWAPNAAMLQGMGQGMNMGDSLAEMQKKMAELKGVPVKQIIRMGSSSDGMAALAQQDQQQVAAQQQQQEQAQPSMKDALKGLGGFGGFGRKKKDREQTQQAPPPQAAGAPGAQAGVMMEMTVLQSEFSTAPIGEDKFKAPSSFKTVESAWAKMARK